VSQRNLTVAMCGLWWLPPTPPHV